MKLEMGSQAESGRVTELLGHPLYGCEGDSAEESFETDMKITIAYWPMLYLFKV